MRKVMSRGVEIAYQDGGKGEPAVVLIHPPLGFRTQLSPLFDHLSTRNRVIAPDLRGTGESGVPATGYAIADYAADVVAVCRDAGVEKAVLCGHSLGAAIALDVAASEPSLAAGVVMLDGAVLFPDQVREQMLGGVLPALETDAWLETLRQYFAARMFNPFDPPALRDEILAGLAKLPPGLAPAIMRDGFTRDFEPLIAAGRYPLMYIHARVPADLDRLRRRRPDAIVASVAGSGHFMAQVVPDQVNAMLDRFLAVLPQAVPV